MERGRLPSNGFMGAPRLRRALRRSGRGALRLLLALALALTSLPLSALLPPAVPLAPSQAEAVVTLTVNDTADAVDADPGDGVCATAAAACTLRAAIQEANALAGADTIILPAGTYTLTIAGQNEDAAATGDLDLTGNLTITGAGAATTIIDGGALDRVFNTVGNVTASLSGVTIQNGNAATSSGGGIYQQDGTLTLAESVVSGNTAQTDGGGIYTGGALTLTDTTISGNTSSNSGGIFICGSSTITLANSTVSGNTASTGTGGGIWNECGTLKLLNSTVSGNSAGNDGGGIDNEDVLEVISSTISGNSAARGGGIDNSGTVSLKNAIVARNTATTAGPDCAGTLTAAGYNLIESTAGCTISGNTTGNITGQDPKLGSLANNGGPTKTHDLLAGSPALDAVPTANCTDAVGDPLTVDQRGTARPQGAACDIGAFELVAPPAAKLAITQVSPASPNPAPSTFSVTVQAQDGTGVPANVSQDTTVSLSVKTGTGTLGGTTTGTIAAGSSSVTISGVTYSKAEPGVVLTATATGGEALTAGESAAVGVVLAGLVSWWKAEGNATDSLGAHHGALQGGASFAAGRVRQAFSLDGIDDYVGTGGWSPGSQWTVLAWVSPAGTPSGRHAIAGGVLECRDWGIVLQDGQFGTVIRQPGGCTQTVSSGVTPTLNTWSHVAGTSDGTTAKIYVNGALKASGTVETNYVGTAAEMRIGGAACCGGENFPGLVDEVQVYNRALSQDEILGIMSSATPAARLAITQVSPARPNPAPSAFAVTVQSRDSTGAPANVTQDTSVSLSLKAGAGTGTLGGTTTGTILAGTSQVTISGVTYSKAEPDVVLTATATGGDALSVGESAPFDVAPGQRVYVLSGGNATADQAVLDALTAWGHTPTLGAATPVWDGTQATLSNFDVVVLLNNYNWSAGSMPTAGQTALISYVAGGGGLVTGEWLIWNIDAGGRHTALDPLVPVDGGDYNTAATTTYTQAAADPIVSKGLPTSFGFSLNNVGGSESFLVARTGATVFYQSSNAGHPGLVGWKYQAGRVISFSTLLSHVELADPDYQRLFANAVEWASVRAPFISLSPASGPAGTDVTITGSGFVPGESVMVHWDGAGHGTSCDPAGMMLTTTTASETGTITAAATVPGCAALGDHTVLAIGAQTAQAVFTLAAPPAATVAIELASLPGVVSVGGSFTVSIQVAAGAQPVDVVDAFLDFNPAKLQVVDADGNPVTAMTPAASPLPVVLQNSVDNLAGRIHFSAGRETAGAAATGSFTLATARLKALAPSPGTALVFSTSAPRKTDAFFGGQPVGLAGPGRTIGITGVLLGLSPAEPPAQVGGTFTVALTADTGPQTVDSIDVFLNFDPAKLRVVDAAGEEATAIVPDAASPLVTLSNQADNALGRIAFSAGRETGQDPVSGAFTLATIRFTVMASSGPSTDITFNRDAPRTTDAFFQGNSVLGPFLAAVSPPPGADLDRDLRPIVGALVVTTGVTLRIDPATSQVNLGGVFTLALYADAGAQQVDRIDTFLDFAPAFLRVVDDAGNEVGAIAPASTSPLKQVLTNQVDNATGRMHFSVERLTTDPAATGSFLLATTRVKAIAAPPEGVTSVSFSNVAPRQTDAVFQEVSVLGATLSGTVVVGTRSLSFTSVPVKGGHGFALGVQPVVAVQSSGATITADNSTVVTLRIKPGTGAPGAVLTCTGGLSKTVSAGVATFAGCTIDLRNTHPDPALRHPSYVLEATAANASAAETPPFAVGWAGDANGNCLVDIADFSLLVKGFGKALGDAGFDAGADMDGDNRVSILDFSVLVTLFGTRCPTLTVSLSPAGEGTAVTVTGAGYVAYQNVTLVLDGAVMATTPPTVVANDNGGFTASFTVAGGLAPGTHVVRASQPSGRVVAAAVVTAP